MNIEIVESNSKEEQKLIALQIPKTMYEDIRKLAYLKDMTISATIRNIVSNYFEKENVINDR